MVYKKLVKILSEIIGSDDEDITPETELTVDTLKTDSFTKFMKASVPLGRYGHEGELNPAAVFLASDEASYITGQNIKVDGGYTSV